MINEQYIKQIINENKNIRDVFTYANNKNLTHCLIKTFIDVMLKNEYTEEKLETVINICKENDETYFIDSFIKKYEHLNNYDSENFILVSLKVLNSDKLYDHIISQFENKYTNIKNTLLCNIFKEVREYFYSQNKYPIQYLLNILNSIHKNENLYKKEFEYNYSIGNTFIDNEIYINNYDHSQNSDYFYEFHKKGFFDIYKMIENYCQQSNIKPLESKHNYLTHEMFQTLNENIIINAFYNEDCKILNRIYCYFNYDEYTFTPNIIQRLNFNNDDDNCLPIKIYYLLKIAYKNNIFLDFNVLDLKITNASSMKFLRDYQKLFNIPLILNMDDLKECSLEMLEYYADHEFLGYINLQEYNLHFGNIKTDLINKLTKKIEVDKRELKFNKTKSARK